MVHRRSKIYSMLLAGILAGSIFVPGMASQSAKPGATETPAQPAAPAPATRFKSTQLPARANEYYSSVWGVDSLIVKAVESGELIKFTYRVLNPEKAKLLGAKTAEPFLIDPRAGVKLVVPTMEKVGQLRQSGNPVEGKTYWMAFSNKGRYVKPGHHVDVVIGQFRAEGLVVQ